MERANYNCEDVRNRLEDYLDQELPLDETFRLLEHLAQCPHCTEVCGRAYSELAELRHAIQRIAPPDGLMQRIQARLVCAQADPGET